MPDTRVLWRSYVPSTGFFWPIASVVVYDDRVSARGIWGRVDYRPGSTELRKGILSSLGLDAGGAVLWMLLVTADISLEEALVAAGFELPPGYLISSRRRG